MAGLHAAQLLAVFDADAERRRKQDEVIRQRLGARLDEQSQLEGDLLDARNREEEQMRDLDETRTRRAELERRLAENKEEVARMLPTGCGEHHQNLAVRLSRPGSVEPSFGRVSEGHIKQSASTTITNVPVSGLPGGSNLKNYAAGTGDTPAIGVSAAADIVETAKAYLPQQVQRGPDGVGDASSAANISGLEEVDLNPDNPVVDSDGAIQAPIGFRNPVHQEHYINVPYTFTTISIVGGYLKAFSCAVDGCGANAPAKSRGDAKFFTDEQSLLSHARNAHSAQMTAEYGSGKVSVKEFSANSKFCRWSPVTPDDLRLIISGQAPASITRNIGKSREQGEDGSASRETVQHLSRGAKRARTAEEEFVVTAAESPQKQGERKYSRSGREIKPPDNRNWLDPTDVVNTLQDMGEATKHQNIFQQYARQSNGAGS
ncbi:hypothetical protein LTR85_007493 [Meristemomyces frigidus]|nr:hypothetical protein LTR85_007493 [Meristemomyces frigidus]